MATQATVNPDWEGKRLDLVLTFLFPEVSRSRARILLDGGKVKVAGEIEYRPQRKMKGGEEVSVEIDAETSNIPQATAPLRPVEIVYQDDDLLVIDKPCGLKVHPTRFGEVHTLLNYIVHLVPGKQMYKLVNRLDADTSGIVLVAISARGVWHFSKQFAQSEVIKKYFALVDSEWTEKYGDERIKLEDFLTYVDGKAQIVDVGQHALTYARSRKRLAGGVLLELEPQTGRTHQLRIQLASRGFAIWGDEKYQGRPWARLCLHSSYLRVQMLDNSTREFHAELPKDFLG